MKILMHYTIKNGVYKFFSRKGIKYVNVEEQIENISKFYKNHKRTQNHMFFIVCYYNSKINEVKYTTSNIKFNESVGKYESIPVSDEIHNSLCEGLGLEDANTYDNKSFYRIFTLEESENVLINKNLECDLSKIKMKFFSWEELMAANDILFNEISDILFNPENVLKVASTYHPNIKYTEVQKKKKYFDALKMIGFISNKGVEIFNNTVLQGDLGEFLMHILLGNFIQQISNEKYIYPKLAFKTSPNMPVYGNDGTIYLKDKKEIYYLESKFYNDLNKAINKAVDSLNAHNSISNESFNHRIEMFRNIKTDQLCEIIEIDEDVEENLAIFIICDDHTDYNQISDIVRKNNKLKNLKDNFNVILFILPILNKNEYLKNFQERSGKVWEELNEK